MRLADALTVMVCTLVATGCVMVYSTTSVLHYREAVEHGWMLKHLAWVLLGFAMMCALRRLRPEALKRHARLVLLGALLLLLAVFVPGIGARINGARRWLNLGPFSFQPSELAKFAVLVFMADFMTRKVHLLGDLRRGFLPPVILSGVLFLLVIVEPDFGTAALTMMLIGAMMLMGGVKGSFLAWTGALALPMAGILVLTASYRVRRLLAFWDPWSDAEGKGYQVVQSLVALGNGGFFGAGLGASNQKLLYLPSSYSDFIFAILGEEMGCLGALLVLGLYGALLWLGWRIARSARSPFSALLARGITLALVLQAAINIAVVTGTVPTKGIPLPFISFGGSSLVVSLAAVGILLAIAEEGEEAERAVPADP